MANIRNRLPRVLFIREVEASFLGVGILVLLLVVLAIIFTPRSIVLRLTTQQFDNGTKNVAVRALQASDISKVLYVENVDATVSEGHMILRWSLPPALKDKSFIVEVCTAHDQNGNDSDCQKAVTGSDGRKLSVKGVQSSGELYSCPYYVAASNTSFLGSLLGNNDIELDNRVYCEDRTATTDEFTAESRTTQLTNIQNPLTGLALSGNGVVSYKDGQLSVVDPTTIFAQKVINEYYPSTVAQNTTPQTLYLSGRTLSISEGNSVILPDSTYPVANSATDGLLSASDWNMFSAKENSLTFDSSFVRNTNTVSLMSCAAGQVMKSDGVSWVCASDIGSGGGSYTAGTGISIDTTSAINNTGLLSASSTGALTTTTTSQNAAISLATSSDFTQLSNQLNLSTTGVTPGTYNNVTVDNKGRVTSATNVAYLTSFTEADGIVGNEVAGVVANGGLVMTGAGTSGDPYKVGLVTTCLSGQLLKYYATDPDGAGPLNSGWNCAADTDTDTDTNTDQQVLTYNAGTNILTLNGGTGGGGTIDLSALATDSQTLSIAGNVISLTNGGSVTLPADQNTTYTATANGGLTLTGTQFSLQACTSGQVLKASATAGQWACAADADTIYTAGTGIGIAGGVISSTLGTDITSSEIVDGTIAAADLANSGATAGTYGDSGVNVAQLTVNAQGQVTTISNRVLPTATTSTTGVLTSADWNTFNGKENVLTFTGNGLFSRSGNIITGLSCTTSGQVAKWNGSNFVCGTDDTSAGSGVSSLNTLNGALTLAAGTTGTDFNVTNVGSTITYNLPSASTTARGAVTTGAQTFGGAKTFNVGATVIGFQVTDGTLPHLTIDTSAKTIQIGSATSDANAIALVLDSYNSATDPTGTNGEMYYNSNLGKFRCYEAGAWKDCITAVPSVAREFTTTTATNSTTTQADITELTAAVTAGRQYIFSCKLTHTTAATTTAGLFTVNGPTSTNINYIVKTGYSTTAEYQVVQTAFNAATNPGTGPGTTARQVFIDGTFTPSTNGTFAVRFASEVGGSAVNVLPNSYCVVE